MPSKWDDRPYTVGKGKPPVGTRFGQPGRPAPKSGRLKGAKNADTIISSALDEKLLVKINGRECRISKFEAVVTQLVNRAVGGDHKAMEMVMRFKREIEARVLPDDNAVPLNEADRAVLAQFADLLREGEENSYV